MIQIQAANPTSTGAGPTPARERQRRARWWWREVPPPPENLGRLILTGSLSDLAIGGGGAFVIETDQGVVLTRIGTFAMRPGEPIAHEAGGILYPQIHVPKDAITIVVSAFGDVLAVTEGGECRYLGTVLLATPQACAGLTGARTGIGGTVDGVTMGWPGVHPVGYVLQGAIELPAGVTEAELGPRFAGSDSQVYGGSLRMTGETAVRVARALRTARRRKESRLDITVARSQAAQLLSTVHPGVPQAVAAASAQPNRGLVGIEPAALVAAQVARRMTPKVIVDAALFNRRYEPDRFQAPPRNGDYGRGVPHDQELSVAQARARQLARGM